ncbi:MAG: helix-turn-helix domain-containing protein [Thermoguttaceae bacterium]
MSEKERLLAPDEVADILRLTTPQISRMATRRVLPAVRLPNGEFRFCASELWAWIEARKQPHSPRKDPRHP